MPESRSYFDPDVLARISDLELRARLVVEGIVSGMHRSPYQGYSIEFAQHKEYVPGDDIRHLDWRVYGKSDRFYIKQFEEESDLRAHILVDCSSSMRYPEQDLSAGRMTKFEYAATLAASLAYLLVHQQDAVGLVLFDDGIKSQTPPLSNHAHLRSILHQLEHARLVNPTGTGALFTTLASHLHRRSIVILISDLLGDAETMIRGIEHIRHARHEVIVMHVLDADEREFPFMDNTLFEGLEAPDLQLYTDPQSLRTGYLAALGEFIQKMRTTCENHRVDFVELSTKDSLDIAIRAYLAARSHMIKANV
jgi:uncharacterized protein (DUF58 family)